MSGAPIPEARLPRVLIVDGSTASRAAMCAALSRLTLQVEEAEEGAAAFQLLLMKPFDLMITSLDLAPINGEQLVLAARLLAPERRPKIIVCLSDCDAGDVAARSELQSVDRVLVKPVSAPVLVSAVSTLLSMASGIHGLESDQGVSAR